MLTLEKKEETLISLIPLSYYFVRGHFGYNGRRDAAQTILLKAWEALLKYPGDDVQTAKGFAKHEMRCTRAKEIRSLARRLDNEWRFEIKTTIKVYKRTYRRGFQTEFIREMRETIQSLPDSLDRNICERVMANYTQTDIAKDLGLHQTTVSRRLKNLKKYFILFA